MKTYLVSYDVNIIKTTKIQVADDYIPSSDNLSTIKKKIIEKDMPRWMEVSVSYSSLDRIGTVDIHKGRFVKKEELKIIAISRLDI